MAIQFQTIRTADGRIFRRAQVTSEPAAPLAGTSPIRRPAAPPQSVATTTEFKTAPTTRAARKIQKLLAEREHLLAEQRRNEHAAKYRRHIDELCMSGCSRGKAVAIASRENPLGRVAYLNRTNERKYENAIEDATVGRPRYGGSAEDHALFALYETAVADELKHNGGDRQEAMRTVARRSPAWHRAFCRVMTGRCASR